MVSPDTSNPFRFLPRSCAALSGVGLTAEGPSRGEAKGDLLGSWEPTAGSGGLILQVSGPASSASPGFCTREMPPSPWLPLELCGRPFSLEQGTGTPQEAGRAAPTCAPTMSHVPCWAVQMSAHLVHAALPGGSINPPLQMKRERLTEKWYVPSYTAGTAGVWQSWDENPVVFNSKALSV